MSGVGWNGEEKKAKGKGKKQIRRIHASEVVSCEQPW